MSLILKGAPAIVDTHPVAEIDNALVRPGMIVVLGYDGSIGPRMNHDDPVYGIAITCNPKGNDSEPYESGTQVEVARGSNFVVNAWVPPQFEVRVGDRMCAYIMGTVYPNNGHLRIMLPHNMGVITPPVIGYAESSLEPGPEFRRVAVRVTI